MKKLILILLLLVSTEFFGQETFSERKQEYNTYTELVNDISPTEYEEIIYLVQSEYGVTNTANKYLIEEQCKSFVKFLDLYVQNRNDEVRYKICTDTYSKYTMGKYTDWTAAYNEAIKLLKE